MINQLGVVWVGYTIACMVALAILLFMRKLNLEQEAVHVNTNWVRQAHMTYRMPYSMQFSTLAIADEVNYAIAKHVNSYGIGPTLVHEPYVSKPFIRRM